MVRVVSCAMAALAARSSVRIDTIVERIMAMDDDR
jgi:hypothetical protein